MYLKNKYYEFEYWYKEVHRRKVFVDDKICKILKGKQLPPPGEWMSLNNL